MRRLIPPAATVITLLALAGTASAHDLFLRLESYFVPKWASLTFEVR